MKARIIGAAVLAAVCAVAATSATGGTKKAQADITVWLQVDAQSGWPDVVAAATAAFQKQHPGVGVKVQYQTWPTHLGKFDATLAGGNTPDVIEMGNTEMTKYMAAGAFQDLTSAKSSFDNSSNWLEGLAASGRYNGKLYGVPYYAGSRVVTYRTDQYRQAGIKGAPKSLAQFTADAAKLNKKFGKKGYSPVYIAGTDWYVAMGFVYDFGGRIAQQVSGKWKGTLDQPKAIAGLTAFKNFFMAASRASKTADESRPTPYSVYADGNAGSIVGPGWFSCCVGDSYKSSTAQFVMPSHTTGQPMPGFLGGSDLAVPIGGEQAARSGLDRGVHEHRGREGAPGQGEHPEHDHAPRHLEGRRAGGAPQLVRPGREELGQRREREYPPHDADADPDREALGEAGGGNGKRQHHVHAQRFVGNA